MAEKEGEERSQNIQKGKVDAEIIKSRPINNSKEDREESICFGHFKKPEIPNGKNLLIISIYAPQELFEKKMLWDYLTIMIGSWNSKVVIMGDFNEVRRQAERYGSIFNVQGANAFNSFISAAGLEEAKVIKGIHGDDGKLNKNANNNYPSIWLDIIQETMHLKNHGMDLCGFINKKMGNGSDTSFWEDVWKAEKMSHENLGITFCRNPWSGIEQAQFHHLSKSLEGFAIVDMRDGWVWSIEGSGEFFASSVRKMIDDHRFSNVSTKTR
nr:RNA-directed DNA polymerase, eukaryota, reverse transcriptase zinc-binding domain protein [Tanacetum cinerariifolium]